MIYPLSSQRNVLFFIWFSMLFNWKLTDLFSIAVYFTSSSQTDPMRINILLIQEFSKSLDVWLNPYIEHSTQSCIGDMFVSLAKQNTNTFKSTIIIFRKKIIKHRTDLTFFYFSSILKFNFDCLPIFIFNSYCILTCNKSLGSWYSPLVNL